MTARTAPDVDVAIVGGGPVGLTLALLLRGLGLPCAVLEADADLHPLPRAVHLDDEALRVLADAGVAGHFPVRAIDGMALVDSDLHPFVTFDRRRGRLGRPASVLMHQPDLERALRARAGGLLRTGIRVTGLRGDREAMQLRTAAGETITARWVVGCDGAASTVRTLAGIGVEDLGFRQRWLVVDLHGVDRAATAPRVLQICDPRRPATSVPVGGGRHRFEVRAGDDEPDAGLVARAPDIVRPALERLGVQAAGIERAAVYEFRGRLARTFGRGRVLLAGDAAHEMPPFLGQGLCTGLRDVANLAWKLAYTVDGRATPRLLDTYSAERRPHARHAIRLSATVGRVVSDRQPVRAAVRNRVLAAAERLLPVAALGAVGVPPLPRGPLVERSRRPRDAVPAGALGTRPGGRGPGRDPPGLPVATGAYPGYGRFVVRGGGAPPDSGVPPELHAWWERLGASFVATPDNAGPGAGAGNDAALTVVRPDGYVLGRYRMPAPGMLSPLAGVAARLSAAGLRVPR